MNGQRMLCGSIFLSFALVAAGCSGTSGATTQSGNGDPQPQSGKTASNVPVTLKVFQNGAEISDEDFQMMFTDPVKKKYPHISLEIIRPSKDVTLNSLLAARDVPDLLLTPNSGIMGLKQQDLLMDITPHVKSQSFNLTRFNPVAIDAVKSEQGQLYGIPYAMQFNALYYNKDIFDKFGKSYPKDGMTWEDAIDLARQLTQQDGGVQYRGLDPASSYVMSFPYSLAYVDGKSDKASMDNEKWKQVFELAKSILTIPGNMQPNPEPSAAASGNLFIKEKNVAMLASTNLMAQIGSAADTVNWDIAQYPSYKDKPNISGKLDSHNIIVSKTTKFPDAAMNVIEVVTSDEVQLLSARKTARMSPLAGEEPKKQFGADVPYLKGKHVQALFKSAVSPSPTYSIYETDGKKIGQQAFRDYAAGKVDLNTALRQADEEINKGIAGKK
ncbi:extracellular solute-binding protein [Paenibacillus hemerocallicola]|uniref:Extracellular solute-binding protein n=1 Tax=Paenibacillus hemerocallicola TaxID=1172614 RepID=A0A5C4T7L4_9BACL|nr:extracellular solute-binding protein [Paenibacillus hemerocallicola]TNJ64845.1 extracellular solute-binding protein [Paenibacillus hemerocallicola]